MKAELTKDIVLSFYALEAIDNFSSSVFKSSGKKSALSLLKVYAV